MVKNSLHTPWRAQMQHSRQPPYYFVIKIWGFYLLINQRNGKRCSRATIELYWMYSGGLLSDVPRVILTLLSCLAISRGDS